MYLRMNVLGYYGVGKTRKERFLRSRGRKSDDLRGQREELKTMSGGISLGKDRCFKR